MKDLLCDEFQEVVGQGLVRHKSILDVTTKIQESSARVNRAVMKSVTSCGCIKIRAEKTQIPPDLSLEQLRDYMNTHVEGTLCESCQETIEAEVGSLMFYLVAMLNTFDLNFYDILIKEHKRLSTLGIYKLS